MNKIFQILNGIQKDKWMHFTIGMVSALLTFILFGWLNFWVGFALSVVACVALAFGKEHYDVKHDGTFDCIDFLATISGGLVAWLYLLIVYYWIF